MKYFIVLLMFVLVAAGLMLFNRDEQYSDEPLTDLPWQIDILADGNTRVFGITPGETTLGEAIELLGNDMDLAIIAAPQATGTLEAYYGHHSFGPITGKLILVMKTTPGTLATMRERGYQDGGTRRYHLHPEDLPAAYRAPVGVITFLPSFNLDEEIVQNRFGTPAEVLQVHARQKHFLYPDKGLDLILNTDSKEILQYLPPHEFNAHRTRLQQAPAPGK